VNLALALWQSGKREEGRKLLESFRARKGLRGEDRERAGELLEQWDKEK
jgi:hypothetical protein